jgi:4-hydroxy-4-methyl-2-oxoglutarate aldolase
VPPFPSTANIADACLALGSDMAVVPGLRAAAAPRMAGAAFPVRHFGSVDVFLEAIGLAAPESILMVDNEARRDEGCIGDLVVREAKLARLGGIAIWGCHRDSADLAHIGFPLFSLGSFPRGPIETRAPSGERFVSARFGDALVTADHFIVADDDGLLAVSRRDWPAIRSEAEAIAAREAGQARLVEAGRPLREQFRFDDYLRQRGADPRLSFRDHLRQIGGEIER